MMMIPPILTRIKAAGYRIFTHGEYNLNLFGIRSKYNIANRFDDLLGAAYIANDTWHVEYWAATTDPGTYWLNNPGRLSGTAILVEGQYRGAYKIGQHRGQYTALTQAKPMKVYRDANKDNILDHSPDTIAEGIYGINIHRSSRTGSSTEVNRWSAGCQVHKTVKGFNRMMELAHKQIEHGHGRSFTYTLLTEEQAHGVANG